MSHLQRRARGDGEGSSKEEGVPLRAPLKSGSRSSVPLWAECATFVVLAFLVVSILLYVHISSWWASKAPSGTPGTPELRLFTPSDLKPYDGLHSSKIYLAIMGSVYDVTPGARHYGKKGSYSFFAGRDASRSYVTGQFQQDLNDDVSDFDAEQFQGLVKWKEFFDKHKEYRLIGHVVGSFYDADGQATPLLGRAKDLAQQERQAMERKRQQQKEAREGGDGMAGRTPCNVRWTRAEGGSVYCPTGQFPRQVAVPGRDGQQVSMRCACFATDAVDASRRLYPGCAQSADSCTTSPPE